MKKLLVFLVFFVGLFFISSAYGQEKKKIIKEETIEEYSESSSVSKGEIGMAPAKKPAVKKLAVKKKSVVKKSQPSSKKTAASKKSRQYKKTTRTEEEVVEAKKADPCEETQLVIISFSTTGPKKEKEKDQVEIFGIAKIPKDGKVFIEFRSGVGDFASLAEIEVKGGATTQLHAPTTPLTIGNWYGARMATELPDGTKCYGTEVPVRIKKETPIARERESAPSVFFVPSDGYYGGGYYGGGGYYSTTHTMRHEYKPPTQPTTPSAPSVPRHPGRPPM